MKRTLTLTISLTALLSLSSCSSNPPNNSNNYKLPPVVCDSPVCAAYAVMTGIYHSKKPSQKCKDLTGERKAHCNQQVQALKQALAKNKR